MGCEENKAALPLFDGSGKVRDRRRLHVRLVEGTQHPQSRMLGWAGVPLGLLPPARVPAAFGATHVPLFL